ncbi:hypothetical protein ACFPOA_00610 [Lysobacter niabensis]|uniref:hypothetical protein n=1 Tax=Agrilutibacter niabensis TaxID=380628 RepID=UPI003610D1CD
MRNLIAAIYFLLAMFGYDSVGTATVTHSIVDGVDVIHSKTRVMAGIARFECISSATGECHYTLFPSKCASGDRDCTTPIDRFTLPKGARREVVGLPKFDACVAQDDSTMQRECLPARPAAGR